MSRKKFPAVPEAPTVPPLEERKKPGLSETLNGERAPNYCQSCSSVHSKENPLQRWQECDELDKKTIVVVVLCGRCSERLIEPHPRLYHRLETFSPFPGAMGVCLDCRLREGLWCKAPQWNERPRVLVGVVGDPAREPSTLHIRYREAPVVAHIQRSPRSTSGFMEMYSGPALECSTKEKSAG